MAGKSSKAARLASDVSMVESDKLTTTQCNKRVTTAIHVVGHVLLFSHLSFIPYVYAAPSGGSVVGGNGEIQQSGSTTTIIQSSDALAIDWNSFNVNSDEIVNYLQPGVSSIALNRILSNDGSQIQGQINANGQVILVNPNGIFFGSTANINVGGLIASGLDIKPADFMNGVYLFDGIDGTSGTVINSGLLNAATGGSITLLGKQVKNEGIISANLGAVNMAAGKEAVVTFDNAGLVGIRVTREVLQDELGVDAALINDGTITAQGGRILMTASQSQDLFSQAVNTGDIKQATSVVVNEDGTFTLGSGADVVNNGSLDVSQQATGQDGGQVVLLGQNVTSSGTIDAGAQQGSGGDIELHALDTTLLTGNSTTLARSESGGEGGIVKVLGDKVGVLDQSTVDVSGAEGGGQALIGGDYQGSNPIIRNAARTYVDDNAQLHADAFQTGNGGKIINWGDEYTWFYGEASARGGSIEGNGGFVEISGKGLSFDGAVDTSAVNGDYGTLLFDPTDIVVYDDNDTDALQPICPADGTCVTSPTTQLSTPPDSTGTFFVSESQLEGLSAGTDLVMDATNNITINDLSYCADSTACDGELNLKFDSTGSLTINAGNAFTMVDPTNTIVTQGGAVTINAHTIAAGNITTTGDTDIQGGAVILQSQGGNLTVGSIITTGGAPSSNNDGTNGGDINIETVVSELDSSICSSCSVTITGVIDSSGSAALNDSHDQKGGNAGSVTIHAGNNLSISGVNATGHSIAASGGNGNGNGNGGGGAAVQLTAENGYLTVVGHVSANGGDATPDSNNHGDASGGSAGPLTLTSNSGQMTLNGNLEALGGAKLKNGTNGTSADITLTASDVLFSGGNPQSISGKTITLASTTNPLQLQQSLTVNAADAATLTGSIYYNGIGTDGSLAVSATNGATVSSGGTITDGGATADADTLTVTINGSSGAVTVGGLTTQGGAVTIDGTSVSTGSILTNGLPDWQKGSGTAGGAVNVTSSAGVVSITGEINTSGSDDYSTQLASQGGNAGAINVSASGDALTIAGDITALGGVKQRITDPTLNGYAGVISLSATGGTMTLGGNVTADQGQLGVDLSILDPSLSGIGDITLEAQTIRFNGISSQHVGGNTVSLSSTTYPLQLQQSLAITAATDATLTGDIDYDGIGAGGSLVVDAANAATVSKGGTLYDSGATADADTLAVIINGNSGTATVGGLTTQGGAVTITGDSVMAAGIDTSGVSDAGTITMIANSGTMDVVGDVKANGGSGAAGVITLSAAGGTLTLGGNVIADQGQLNADVGVTGKLSGDITLNAQSIVFNGGGAHTVSGNDVWLNTTSSSTVDNTLTVNAEKNLTVDGDITGGAALTLAFGQGNVGSNTLSLNGVVSGFAISSINGGSGAADTIDVSTLSQTNNWKITASNQGTFNQFDFSNVENLNSGNGADTFTLLAGGSLDGVVNGNGGADELIGPDAATSWIIVAPDEGGILNDTGTALIGGGFRSIEKVTGGSGVDLFTMNAAMTNGIDGGAGDDVFVVGASTLSMANLDGGAGVDRIVGSDSTNNWVINGANIGEVTTVVGGATYAVSFVNIESLTGGAAGDTFTLVEGAGKLDGQLDGGSGADTLYGPASLPTIWTITGVNQGDVADSSGATPIPYIANGFVNVENLVSGSGDDTIVFESGSLSGTIDAGGGYDGVDYSSLSSISVNFADAFKGVQNADYITGNGDGFELIGADTANTWAIDGENTGTLTTASGSVRFVGFAELTGGASTDSFVFDTNGSVTGKIDGRAGSDSLDMTQVSGNINLVLGGNVDNVETINGNTLYTTLTGKGASNTWHIDGANSGTYSDGVNSVAFYGVKNLVGGIKDDSFYVESNLFTGSIDGGAHINGDTVDYHALSVVSVDLANNNLSHIEKIVGNNSDSTLIGRDLAASWVVSGNNSGSVSDSVTGVVDFVGFNILQGGSGTDDFSVQSGGSIGNQVSPSTDSVSGIFAGDGDDRLVVSLNGSETGTVRFDGGANNAAGDSVTVSGVGGESEYYDSNVNFGYDRLTYANGTNSYAVNYKSAEVINDDVNVSTLYVNGTSGDDAITLGVGFFALSGVSQVNYSNKVNLSVDASAGSDVIDVSGNVLLPVGQVALSAETITSSTGSITANNLLLSNASAIGVDATSPLMTNVRDISFVNVIGDAYINELNGIYIDALTNFSGTLYLTSVDGDIADATSLTTGANMQLTAGTGNIVLDGANSLSGELSMLAANGDVTLNNETDTMLGSIDTRNLTVTTSGSLGETGNVDVAGIAAMSANDVVLANANNLNAVTVDSLGSIALNNGGNALVINGLTATTDVVVQSGEMTVSGDVVTAGAINLSSSQGITMGAGTSAVSSGGNVQYDASGDVMVSYIEASQGDVVVGSSNGNIYDINTSGSASIKGYRVSLNAATGIGSDTNYFDTQASVLNVVNTAANNVEIANNGNVTLELVQNDAGGIDIVNSNDIAIDRVQADISSGRVSIISTNGDITAVGPTPEATPESADVTAYSASFFNARGNFGEPARPIVVYAPGDISVFSLISFDPVFMPLEPSSRISDTSLLQFSAFDTLTALAGEQVVELESLDDIDPAIFTNVHNYNMAEISIHMPRDQLYEDELDKYGQR